MNGITKEIKRRLILEQFKITASGSDESFFTDNTIKNLKREMVATIFIISHEKDISEYYMRLVQRFETEGFLVRNICLEQLDDDAIPVVKNIVEEISWTFQKESCAVISYGPSIAPQIIACYYVYSEDPPSKAITKVRKMDPRFLAGSEEVAFVYKFKHFISQIRGMSDNEYIFRNLQNV